MNLVVPNPSLEEILAIRKNLKAQSPKFHCHRQRRVAALQCTSHQLLTSILGCGHTKTTPSNEDSAEPVRKRAKRLNKDKKIGPSVNNVSISCLVSDLTSDVSWKGYFHTVWLDYCGSISAWGRSDPFLARPRPICVILWSCARFFFDLVQPFFKWQGILHCEASVSNHNAACAGRGA